MWILVYLVSIMLSAIYSTNCLAQNGTFLVTISWIRWFLSMSLQRFTRISSSCQGSINSNTSLSFPMCYCTLLQTNNFNPPLCSQFPTLSAHCTLSSDIFRRLPLPHHPAELAQVVRPGSGQHPGTHGRPHHVT